MQHDKTRGISNISMFWRFLLLLTVVMTVFLASLFVTSRLYTQKLRSEYLSQTEDMFRQNCSSFSSDIGLLYSLPASLENATYYSYVSYFRSTLPENRYFALNALRRAFVKEVRLLQMQEDGFFVFKGSYSGSARLQSFPYMDDCFEHYMVYENLSAQQMKQILLHVSGMTVLPMQNVSIGGNAAEEYLTVLISSSSSGSTLVTGMLYPRQAILDSFGVTSLPPSTFFSICAADGTELLSSNMPEDTAGFCVLTCPLSSMGCTASLGIPDSYFRSVLRPITRRTSLFITATFLLGVVLCIWFSSISVRPMRKLLSDYAGQTDDAPRNELHAISHLLVQNQQSQEQLHATLLSGLLDRAFAGLEPGESELRHVNRIFQKYFDSGTICVIRNLYESRHESHSQSPTDIIDRITALLGDRAFVKYIRPGEIGILCSSSVASGQELFNSLLLINEELDGAGFLVCGVSLPFHGAEDMSKAAYQAYSALPLSEDLILNRYSESAETAAPARSTVPGQMLEQFYQALRQWDRKAAFNILDAIEEPLSRTSAPVETVNLFLYILRDAADAALIPFPSEEIAPAILTAHDGARLLHETTKALFDLADERYSGSRKELQREILSYVNENYSDCSLCIDSIASHFNLSSSFVAKSFPLLTGKTFNKYLTDVRMNAAAAKLAGSGSPIDDIAAACGYPAQSTFYRVFKKRYSVSPMQFRVNAQKKKTQEL